MKSIAGIDEAGRGPVIGPMVIVGVLIDEIDEVLLKGIGVKDSKMLTPEKRQELYGQIKQIVKSFAVRIIPPKEIDDAVESEELNLNWLEAIKTAEILNELKPDMAYIDCPSTNLNAYRLYLHNKLSKEIKLVVEHRADQIYAVCSAASILAKVIRDKEIDKLKERYNVDFGSGYPSDIITKLFLEKNFDKYPFFRKSWVCYRKATAKKKQKSLGDFKH